MRSVVHDFKVSFYMSARFFANSLSPFEVMSICLLSLHTVFGYVYSLLLLQSQVAFVPVPVYVNALIVNAEPVGWLVVTDALCSFSHSVDYAQARDLFFHGTFYVHRNRTGRRMGEGMRAQVHHFPVRTAPQL